MIQLCVWGQKRLNLCDVQYVGAIKEITYLSDTYHPSSRHHIHEYMNHFYGDMMFHSYTNYS